MTTSMQTLIVAFVCTLSIIGWLYAGALKDIERRDMIILEMRRVMSEAQIRRAEEAIEARDWGLSREN